MADELFRLFGLVCGQSPEHTWAPGGVALPLCQRCTGLYAGAAIALLLHAALRLRPSNRFLLLHGGFLLLMVPLGYHWVPQDGVVRTLSGLLFGAGVVCFLWLTVGSRLHATREPDRYAWAVYATALAGALLLIPLLATRGDTRAWYLLAAMATLGFAALAVLTLAQLVLAARWLWRRAAHAGLAPLTAAPGGTRASPAGRSIPPNPPGAARPR